MKLELVILSNYGSHVDTRWELDGAGLCVLVGPNGAGKTTLAVDALMHVLQDGAAGGADDVVRTGATDAMALVEFSFGGVRYRATRRRTTRSGGKTSAELASQAADGSWAPLATGAREVPAAVRELLRMDAATFRSAVVLAQGEADRFLRATPGKGTPSEPGRAAILAAIVVPTEFPKAEARARELARDVEARTAAERSSYDRLEAAIAELAEVDAILEGHRRELAGHEAALTVQRSARNDVEARIRDLDAKLLAAAALGEEIDRLEAERGELASDWQAAHKRVVDARATIAAAEEIAAAAADVDRAAAELPALRAEVDRLVALEAEDRRITAELESNRHTIEELNLNHRHRVDEWRGKTSPLTARIATLEDEGRHAARVECPKCGEKFAAGEQRILEALRAARAELKAAGDEPKEPVRISTERAVRLRLEAKRADAGFDPAEVAKLQRELTNAVAIAARAEGIDQARAAIAREKIGITATEAEKTRLTAKGEAVTARLIEARAKAAEVEPLNAERSKVAGQLLAIDEQIKVLERAIGIGQQLVARAEANVEQRDKLALERDALTAQLAASSGELGLLRRLVTAFGVTGIPARIIEGVLPELSAYANELLAELRPGVTVEVRGQRAKADGSGVIEAIDIVVRDELGERVLERWSGGETTSIALGLALGLSRLGAGRAGSAIETLIVDEPDGLDEDARRALGHALRGLVHRGDLARIVAITHTPELAEFADRVDRLTKNGSGTQVERIA